MTAIWNALLCPGAIVPRLALPTTAQFKAVFCRVTTASANGAWPSLRTAKNCVTVLPGATPTVGLDGMRTGLLVFGWKVTVTVAISTSSALEIESSADARTVNVTGTSGGVGDVDCTIKLSGTNAPGANEVGDSS